MNQASAYCAFNNRLCRRKKIREDIIWKPIKSWSSSNPALLFLGQFPAHLPRRSPVRHAKFWPLRLPWSTRFCLAERCPLAVLRYASVQFQPQKRITKKKKCIEREKKTVSALRKPSVINEDPSRGAAPLKTGYTTRNKSPNRRPWPNSTRLSLTAFYLATAVSRLSVPPISGSRRFPAIHARLHGGDPFVAVISAAESRRAPGRRRGCLPCFVFFFLFGSCKSPRMSCLSCHRHHLSTLDGAPLVPTVFPPCRTTEKNNSNKFKRSPFTPK